jgi:hypothetical protein
LSESTPVDGPGTVSRRDLLKRSALTGTLIWAAPVIERVRPAPAFAQMSPPSGCIILSPESDDKNISATNDCITPTPPGRACCGRAFGNSGQVDRFTFSNPAPNCTQIVVRTVTLDCNPANINPDVGQFAVIIESATGPGCGTCTILDAVLINAGGRTISQSLNNGPVSCPAAGSPGTGVDASLIGCPLVDSSLRLAVRLTCQTGCAPI